jgi:hypothetical protein
MADWKGTLYHPKIVHYTLEKPWIDHSLPRYSHFFNYLDRTRYRNAFKGPRLERIIGFRLNYFLWSMKNYFLELNLRIRAKLRRLLRPSL